MKTWAIIAAMAFMACGSAPDCTSLVEFSSHPDAIRQVRSVDFAYTYEKDTPKSSWIKTGYYYSCDNETGFLIIRNKEETELIFQDVPLKVWEEFTIANSHGRYTNVKIIGHYPISIKEG